MIRVILLYIFSLLLFIPKTFSQSHISFNHLTVENGLSQSSVTCILQDSHGFMWFGTQDGLNRFDGYNFKIFKNNPIDSTTLTDNFIFSIYEDSSGTLYIETQSGTFHKYNPALESFKVVDEKNIDFTHAKESTFKAILRESSGIVWTGDPRNSAGLTRLDTKSGETTIFKHNPENQTSISDDKVYSILRDRSGNLWIGTFSGLDRLDELTGNFFHYKNDPDDPNSLPDNWVWTIYEDSHENIWIGTMRGGLSRFDPESKNFFNYKNNQSDPTSINDNTVFSICEGKSGVIWIGTNQGGINDFHPSTQAFEHYKHEPGNKNSINDDVVLSLLSDKDGNYWIGTANGGLNKFNYKSKRFTAYTHDPSNPNSLISNSVQSLLQDRNGTIWIGTLSNGLDAFNPNNNSFVHYSHNPEDSTTLTDDRIYSLAEDTEGNIWIGTYGGGLNKYAKSTGKFYNYQHNDNDKSSISSSATWSIAFDDEGKLWIGTFGGGVNIFNPKNGTFEHLKNNPDDPKTISDDNIIRVFKDSKGNMWFGTTKGLSMFSKELKSFKNYDEEDGLANNFVYGIEEDNKGNLWMSTNDGLSKFNPDELTFKNYYYENGLQGNEFNQNAYAKDKKTGRLLFGGPNGFNVFNPESITGNNFVPPISFTNYLRYNTDDEEGKPIVEKGISIRDSIFLTYKDNIVTLEFSALSFFNNLENQYRYKLEGFNDNWIQLGNNHTVTFTNLSPGDYNLVVTGSNNDGVWNQKGKTLYVEVTPPWWRTNIAYGIYIISFIGILYGLRRFELNRREQKARLRENQLRLKATEAEKKVIEAENERKTKELEEARQLQLSMLPKEVPKLPHLEIAAFMRTATEVGGDYYDFIVQENGVLNVGFGDATGHGLQAGTMVTLMKGFFTSDAAKLELQDFMNHCTNMIKEIKLGRILMSFSLLRIHDHKLIITSAGMPPVYFYDKEKNETEEILIQGMPLGAMRKFAYKTVERELKSGDTILLLTDGLPEQMNDSEEMFDYMRVKNNFNELAQNKPDEIIKSLTKLGDDWMNEKTQDDDITFVVIKVV